LVELYIYAMKDESQEKRIEGYGKSGEGEKKRG